MESATLRLHAVDPSDRGGDFYLVEDDTWSEETVTWSSAPAGGILPVYSLGSVVKDNWYEVDVTSLVAGDGVVSLRAGSTSADGADYSSKEAGAGVAPELRVQTR